MQAFINAPSQGQRLNRTIQVVPVYSRKLYLPEAPRQQDSIPTVSFKDVRSGMGTIRQGNIRKSNAAAHAAYPAVAYEPGDPKLRNFPCSSLIIESCAATENSKTGATRNPSETFWPSAKGSR